MKHLALGCKLIALSLFFSFYLSAQPALDKAIVDQGEDCLTSLRTVSAITIGSINFPLWKYKPGEPTDRSSGARTHRWIIPSLSPHSAFIKFQDVFRGEIFVEETRGSKEVPGLGRTLFKALSDEYPNRPIYSYLAWTNGRRVLEAIQANPQNPDLSKVPRLSATARDYSVQLVFSRNEEPIKLLKIVVELAPLNRRSAQLWLNRTEVLSDPEYQAWVKSGFESDDLIKLTLEDWQKAQEEERKKAQNHAEGSD